MKRLLSRYFRIH